MPPAAFAAAIAVLAQPARAEVFNAKEVFERCSNGVVEINSPTGSGAGFFVSSDGWVLTNRHVVSSGYRYGYSRTLYGRDDMTVTLRGDQDAPVVRVETIPELTHLDLALLKVRVDSGVCVLPILPEGDAATGEDAVAVGHPAGLRWTQTKGSVSGDTGVYMQTDIAINPGNSGGPLLNGRGQVIGVATAGIPSMENTGFAIKASLLREALTKFGLRYRTQPTVLSGMASDERIIAGLMAEREALQGDRLALERQRREFEEDRREFADRRIASETLLVRGSAIQTRFDSAQTLLNQIQMRESEVVRRENRLAADRREAAYLFPPRLTIELLARATVRFGGQAPDGVYGMGGSISLLHRFDVDRRSATTEDRPANRVGFTYTLWRAFDADPFVFRSGFRQEGAVVVDIRETLRLGAGVQLSRAESGQRPLVFPFELFITRVPVPFSVGGAAVVPVSLEGVYGRIGLGIGFGANLLRI